MFKKIHIIGNSPCLGEFGYKVVENIINKISRIDAIFAKKEDSILIGKLKNRNNASLNPIKNAIIFYDSKTKFIMDYLKENVGEKTIIVIASGDPNFFGIGGTVLKNLGSKEKKYVEIYPWISFMQVSFSKLKITMADSEIISLHRRSIKNMFRPLYSLKNIGIFTDELNNPEKIFAFLLERGFVKDFNFHVLSDICNKNEKIYSIYDYKMADMDYLKDFNDKKNIVILERKPVNDKNFANNIQVLGFEDGEFFHCEGEPTKKEVRSISLSMLELKKNSIMIDAGCGSGSISIEASAVADDGVIYAIDKNKLKIENLMKNIRKFRRPNIEPILGELPDTLNNVKDSFSGELIKPDSIFIGGGGILVKEILDASFKMLKQNGVIVINSIMLDSFNRILSFINDLELKTAGAGSTLPGLSLFRHEIISVNISRLKSIAKDALPKAALNRSYFKSLNQVYITKITKLKST
jgi:precorrin-6Y C5,15-methyltransferase (decarboxylating)